MSDKKVLPKKYNKILIERKAVIKKGVKVMKIVSKKILAKNVSLSATDVITLNEWVHTTSSTIGVMYKRNRSINLGQFNPFK